MSSERGYRRKPTWIPIVAAFFMLTPFGNFLLTLASLNVPRWWAPDVWNYWVRYVPPTTWWLMSLIFLSGLALLLFVRTWALVWTLATMAVVVAYNLAMIRAFSLMGTVAVTAMTATTIAAGYFLYFSRFRKPYMNPKIRWWETSPRFRAEISVRIDGVKTEGVLVDVSETGCLVEWKDVGKIPAEKDVGRLRLPPDVIVPCSVARATPRGYGLRFKDMTAEEKKLFKDWFRQLEKDPSVLKWA